MPLKFWDEAFLTAVHLINILPSRVINNETPVERLLHTKPDYKSLRVFGCACWPNLRPYNNRKLLFRSKQCVFIGYSPQHKGVKCLDVSMVCVYISRDVVFDETVFPFAHLHPNAGALLQKEILLLPSHLTGSDNGDGFTTNDQLLTNSPTNGGDEFCDEAEKNGTENDEEISQNCHFMPPGCSSSAIEADPPRDRGASAAGSERDGTDESAPSPAPRHDSHGPANHGAPARVDHAPPASGRFGPEPRHYTRRAPRQDPGVESRAASAGAHSSSPHHEPDASAGAAAGSSVAEPGHDVEVRGAEDPGTPVAGPDPCASVPTRDGWLARLA